MLASLGFTIAGLAFGLFAYTFNIIVVKHAKLRLQEFANAYYALAVAFLLWGIASAINNRTFLRESVMLGDDLLLLGTALLASLSVGKKHRTGILTGIGLVALILAYTRAMFFFPDPYLQNGILFFNTQRPVYIVIGLLIVGIWLPVNVRVAKLVTYKIKHAELARLYSAIYAAGTIAALLFITARRTLTVVLSFCILILCFVLLLTSNIVVTKLARKHHGKAR